MARIKKSVLAARQMVASISKGEAEYKFPDWRALALRFDGASLAMMYVDEMDAAQVFSEAAESVRRFKLARAS